MFLILLAETFWFRQVNEIQLKILIENIIVDYRVAVYN